MGRYYAIAITPPANSTFVGPQLQGLSTSPAPVTYTSTLANFSDDPGALNIEFDFLEYPSALPSGNCTLVIHGIPLGPTPNNVCLSQAQQLYGGTIKMAAGMSNGLPLASLQSKLAGQIMNGTIIQSFGNWAGTEMSITFVLYPAGQNTGTPPQPGYTQAKPGNFSFNWKPGSKLQSALTTTLQGAYPGVAVQFLLGRQWVAPANIGPIAAHPTLSSIAQFIKSNTQSNGSATTSPVAGVDILYRNNGSIVVTDWTQPSQTLPKQIQFTDMIGQPTWIQPATMQLTTIMRADIEIGTQIRLPVGLQDLPGLTAVQQASFPSQLKYQSVMQGTFFVNSVRQIGNFRDPSGSSWVTVLQCIPTSWAPVYG